MKNGLITNANGDKHWYQNGKLHRLDGPAIEWANGVKSWWIDGKRHRIDGPACEYANGNKEWWINGKQLTEEEFNQQYQQVKLSKQKRINRFEAILMEYI